MRSNQHYIMGRNCIAEVVHFSSERLVKVYTCLREPRDPLCKELHRRGISIKFISKQELMKLVNSDSHGGYVASVRDAPQPGLRDFLESVGSTSLVLLLDSIYDPHNLGAIFRAAECFGADLVIYSKNRGAEITPVSSKTSVGATELVPFLRVSNLAETLKAFQKADFQAVAAEATDEACTLDSFQFPKKTLLLLGSEGSGIQPLLRKRSDFHIKIPMRGRIDSLNVSQAAAVLLCAYRTQLNDTL